MAFTGLHAVAGYRGGIGFRKSPTTDFYPTASQSVASATLSTITLPGITEEKGQALFQIYAAADSWVAIGTNPDPTVDPRTLVKGLTHTYIPGTPGDKLKWVAA